jgi:hypothetical protein
VKRCTSLTRSHRIGLLDVGVDPKQLGDVPEGCGLGLDPTGLGGQGGAFGLEGGMRVLASRFRSSTRLARALRWLSIADKAALVRPRLAASSMAASI